VTNALGARQDKNGSLRLEPHTQAHSGPSSIHHSRAHRRTAPSHHIVPPDSSEEDDHHRSHRKSDSSRRTLVNFGVFRR
jgi:hypothetical protein